MNIRSKLTLEGDDSIVSTRNDDSGTGDINPSGSSRQVKGSVGCAKCSTRILISLTVTQKDFGLHVLYQQLLAKGSQLDKAQHVKRMLFESYAGKIVRSYIKATDLSKPLSSIKVQFPINGRDLGLEWLYRDLAPMLSSTERNLHVRKLLHEACTRAGERVAQIPDVNVITTREKDLSPAFVDTAPFSTLSAGIEHWDALTTESDDKSKRRRQNMLSI